MVPEQVIVLLKKVPTEAHCHDQVHIKVHAVWNNDLCMLIDFTLSTLTSYSYLPDIF